MKIAVSGKGGVGKTTLVSCLCKYFSKSCYSVIAIDADPDINLPKSLGFKDDEKITPIIEMKELIAERTQSKDGFYKLNPYVSDIPDKFFAKKDNIKLFVMGTIRGGGSGCVCPENTFLKALLSHILFQKNEVVIIDMPAGIEHLGRGTVSCVDALIIVSEPTEKSISTAKKIKDLAQQLNIKNLYLVGNKIRNKDDKKYIEENLSDFNIISYIPYSEQILLQDKNPDYIIEDKNVLQNIEHIIKKIK